MDVSARSRPEIARPETAQVRPSSAEPVEVPGVGIVADRLGAEVRDSAVLLALSLAVTVGLASGVQALLSVLA